MNNSKKGGSSNISELNNKIKSLWGNNSNRNIVRLNIEFLM